MLRNLTTTLFLAAAGLQIAAAAPPAIVVRGRAMGTDYAVQFDALPPGADRKTVGRAVQAELDRLEQIFSLYRADSELSRFNAKPADRWITVTDDLYQVAERALQLAADTDGAFDPTVGPLVRVWKLREVQADWRPPSSGEIAAAWAEVGWKRLELRREPTALRKQSASLELDLNALVEGYAIDRLVELLRSLGLRSMLVELGGEFRACGTRADGKPWRVGIEDPRQPSQLYAVVELSDGAVATSGDYRQAHMYEGRRYSHLLDPRTGAPIEHAGTSVSVIADDALTADGWATALMILGPEAGRALAERRGLAASFVRREPVDARVEYTTRAYRRFQPPP